MTRQLYDTAAADERPRQIVASVSGELPHMHAPTIDEARHISTLLCLSRVLLPVFWVDQ